MSEFKRWAIIDGDGYYIDSEVNYKTAFKRAQEYNGRVLEVIRAKKPEYCPPHEWDDSGERCKICGDKDWMT